MASNCLQMVNKNLLDIECNSFQTRNILHCTYKRQYLSCLSKTPKLLRFYRIIRKQRNSNRSQKIPDCKNMHSVFHQQCCQRGIPGLARLRSGGTWSTACTSAALHHEDEHRANISAISKQKNLLDFPSIRMRRSGNRMLTFG